VIVENLLKTSCRMTKILMFSGFKIPPHLRKDKPVVIHSRIPNCDLPSMYRTLSHQIELCQMFSIDLKTDVVWDIT
jgi:hypothetical protein